jgi:plastocyanin
MSIAMRRRSVLSGFVAAFAATTFASKFSAFAHGTQATATPPARHEVEIHGFKFEPATLVVRPGDTITWTNRDLVPHTATAHDKSWDTGRIDKGQSASIVFQSGMETGYFCKFHPAMQAELELDATA